ncbi:MAG: hypothetical protein AAF826_00280 [Pseudomonadota bacterium]
MDTIKRFRGDTYPIKYCLKDKAGDLIDLTGWTFRFTINASENPLDATNQIAQFNGSIPEPETGEVEFAFADDVPSGRHYFDVESTNAVGEIRTLVKGALTIVQDVTK